MAKRLKILDPHADLCAMLERWVIHSVKSATGGLGYPRKSLDFSYVTSPASSVDPVGFGAEDHRELEASLELLAEIDREVFTAIKMHYMPWTVIAACAAGFPFAPHQTFYDRLKRGHVWLESELRGQYNRRKERRS